MVSRSLVKEFKDLFDSVLDILNSERENNSPVINRGLHKRQLENNASQIT